MNWEAFGAVGEVIGAIAVVITLLFLLQQIRQNTKSLDESRRATVSQLYQFRAQMHMDGMLRKAEGSGLKSQDVMAKLQETGIQSLSAEERLFLTFHATADAVRLDNGLFQHKNGFMDDEYRDYIERAIRYNKENWQIIGLLDHKMFRQGFIDEVERIWAESNT